MDEIVLEVVTAFLTAKATGNMLPAVKQTLQALKGSSKRANKEGWIAIFDNQSHSNRAGNFQVGAVTQDMHGHASITMCAFYFEKTDRSTTVLWFQFTSANSNVWSMGTGMTLNSRALSAVRHIVIGKIDSGRERYLTDL